MTQAQFRIASIQAVLLLAAALPLVGSAYWVLTKMRTAEEVLHSLEPRHARLLGLEASKVQLAQSAQAAQAALANSVYPSTADSTQTANTAQERIRGVFTDSKLDVASIQVTPVKEDGPFEQAGIVVKVEGDLVAVQNALASIDTLKPRIVVDSVALQVVGGVKPKQPVRLSVQVSMLFWRVR